MRYTPVEELKGRKERLQLFLQKESLDGVLLCENMDLFYFSGSMQRGFLFIPVEGEAVYMVQRSFIRAKEESALENIVSFQSTKEILPIINNYGFNPKRIGLELDILPTSWFFRLKKALANIELTDASYQVRMVRTIKSPYEINIFREMAAVVDQMYKQVPLFFKEGMTEIEMAAKLENFLREKGHQGIGRMRGFNQELFFGHLFSGANGGRLTYLESPTGGMGLSPAQPQSAGKSKINSGEVLLIDYGGAREGYIVDTTRCYAIGEVPDKLLKAHNAALEIQEIVMKKALPGANCGELYEVALQKALSMSFADNFMGFGDNQVRFIGHGVGLEYDEFPYIAKGSRFSLEENMVIALEPKFIFPEEGAVGVENSWHITSSGAEKLTETSDEMVTL